MKAQVKIRWVPIGIGLIFLPVLIVEFVFKFARSREQFYPKKDQTYKLHPSRQNLNIGILTSCTRFKILHGVGERVKGKGTHVQSTLYPFSSQAMRVGYLFSSESRELDRRQ